MLARWLAVVGIILVLAVAGYVFVTKSSRNAVPNFSNSNLSSECTPKFTHHFTDIAIIDSIVPPIFRNSKGIMPTMLINITGRAPLYMPANGKLVQGSYHNEEGAQFYMWEIDIGCNVTVVFDHVTEPMEKVKRLFPSAPRDDSQTDFFETPLEMAAGELVGYTTGSVNAHNWNFAVYNASEKNYLWETGEFSDRPKYYTQVCPFKYYDRSMAQDYEKLFTLSLRDLSVEKNLCED
ncbi:MAG: hypothetical protein A3D74_02650 [Candidatus Levybacteria bacterium RIFCSPHIGHO2_02_FULL_37_13]|nr:MAG: hypothetical protein A3D74_02650 [Candidatus Levybacteria bacterium RIFCSPHIGHO2_02_FULL_37_13]OGH29911.1 MAG: hypothetical protein A3E40_05090 [Candidatus Levybacteria bacterium RIFCSPHIGHO2_12_FULL_37_9]OGH38170.1 MAG: hypothetical protein A3B41_05155 [Candidatus Levybacteria bacterium RIFCSPLOWO2_01_FULL_37_26]